VVCLDDGALREIVTPDVGFICKDLEEMAQVLINGRDIEIDSKTCRSRAEMFSREKMAETYLTCYRKILSGDEW